MGIGKIGFTLHGHLISAIERGEHTWATIKQRGDCEANCWTNWTPENLDKLTKLIGLQKRRAVTPEQIAKGKQLYRALRSRKSLLNDNLIQNAPSKAQTGVLL